MGSEGQIRIDGVDVNAKSIDLEKDSDQELYTIMFNMVRQLTKSKKWYINTVYLRAVGSEGRQTSVEGGEFFVPLALTCRFVFPLKKVPTTPIQICDQNVNVILKIAYMVALTTSHGAPEDPQLSLNTRSNRC